MLRTYILGIALLFIGIVTNAQNCKQLNYSYYDKWNELSSTTISKDGAYVCWEWNPQSGDGKLIVYNTKNQHYDTIQRAASAAFFPDGQGLVYKIKPPFDSLRKQQLAGVSKEKQLKDSLAVWFFQRDTVLRFPKVKAFTLAGEEGHFLALLHDESYKIEADTAVADSLKPKKATKKKSPKKDNKTSTLKVVDLLNINIDQWEKVSAYGLSEKNNALAIMQQKGDSIDSTYVWRFQKGEAASMIFSEKGQASQPAFDLEARQFAFLHTSDTGSRKLYQLVYAHEKDKLAKVVLDSLSTQLPNNFTISEHRNPTFSEDGTALYLGLKEKPAIAPKDSLTADEKVSLDIWHWQDGRLQTQQQKELDKDKKSSYLSVYYPDKQKLIRLADETTPEITADLKLHSNYFLGADDKPYELLSSWHQQRYRDIYLVNRITGEKKLLLKKHASFYSLSPDAAFLLFYNTADSSWNAISTRNLEKNQLTTNRDDYFYDLENNVPGVAGPYGFAGWTSASSAVVYSRNHVWLLDPAGKKPAYKLTKETEKDIRYRYVKLDQKNPFIGEQMYLAAFDREAKTNNYSLFNLKTNEQKPLTNEDNWHSSLIKAEKADVFIYRKETFQSFPDIYFTSNNFSLTERLSDANPQQKDFCFGHVELVNWNTFTGEKTEGLLYYPANFSADSSYPMIVYFYETHSENLHRHIVPRPSRSTINISEYTSRGYFVFTPDIRYRTGFPGQSAYDAIMSGTQSMIERVPQIDKNRMGLQGQSWGGYQTAWLITRTKLFKAAMAGAPVSNMTSAYGGIRWESGVVRAFQYEEGQSRIGANLWENLPAYIENSPLFYADRIETPLLIMSNDADGAVPWYQGIELFNAMRRLQKPAWMLVYNNAPHNLSRRADAMDLSRRLQQFFDHYLKGTQMPEWMTKGVPATKKGVDFGFETE